MRSFVPVLAVTLMASSAFAVSARADDVAPPAAPAGASAKGAPLPSSSPDEDEFSEALGGATVGKEYQPGRDGLRPPGGPPSALGGATPVAREASPPSNGRDVQPSNPSGAEPRTTWVANRPLLVVGAGLAMVGYGPNFVSGLPSAAGGVLRGILIVLTLGSSENFQDDRWQHGAVQLLIPFVGPITFASSHPRDSVLNPRGAPLSGTTKALLYTSSALQIAGVSSMLLSLALGRREPVPEKAAAGPSIYVAPLESSGVAGATVGLSLGVQRW